MSHFKRSRREVGKNSLREAACQRKSQGRLETFIHKGGGGGAGLFETMVREAEDRRQANDIKGEGRLDLCNKPSLNSL